MAAAGRHRAGLFAAFALCAGALPAFAQSAQSRREDLAKVGEMLGDPDPLMRLANMEAIVSGGDGLKIRLATRIAFASDDAELRGLALRAYLATHKELTFDVALPAAVQKQFDTATPNTMPDMNKQYPYVAALNNVAFRFKIVIKDYSFGQDTGRVVMREAPFTITGEKFSMSLDISYLGTCYVDFSPGRKQNLEGFLACQGGWPRLAITSPAS